MNKLFYMFPVMMCIVTYGALAHPIEHNDDFEDERNSDIECSLCHFIADKVTDYLKQNKTETEIIQELQKVCKWTGKWESECDNIIESYGKIIIEDVLTLGDQKVCELIGLCTRLSSLRHVEFAKL
jgi:hypothetical protein